MDFAGALFAVGHKRVEFRALGLRKVYFPATRWHTPSWWSESTKILQLSKDLLEKLLSRLEFKFLTVRTMNDGVKEEKRWRTARRLTCMVKSGGRGAMMPA